MKIATFSYTLSNWPSSLEAWEKDFLGELDQVIKDGAEIVLYPELFLMGLAQYFSGDLDSQIKEVANYTEKFFKSKVEAIIAKRIVFVCLGTGPRLDGSVIKNTSWIWNNGSWAFQDKIHLTPWESAFTPGDEVTIFNYKKLKIATLICFDVEQPTLCSKLKAVGIHLLLVPSATVDRNGSQRVNRCASARSIELGAAVMTAPLIGKSTCELVDLNEGRQGLFLPAQAGVNVDQESYSKYSADEKVYNTYELNIEMLLSLKEQNGETKPYLTLENSSVTITQ